MRSGTELHFWNSQDCDKHLAGFRRYPMKRALVFLLMISTCGAQTIASRRYAELTPLQYKFGPFKAIAPYNNIPNYTSANVSTVGPSSAQMDNNTFASTANFTVVRQTDVG